MKFVKMVSLFWQSGANNTGGSNMEAAIRKHEKHYTYADYFEWDTEHDTVTVGIFPDMRVSLTKIFAAAKL
jgi:hypothetical protein